MRAASPNAVGVGMERDAGGSGVVAAVLKKRRCGPEGGGWVAGGARAKRGHRRRPTTHRHRAVAFLERVVKVVGKDIQDNHTDSEKGDSEKYFQKTKKTRIWLVREDRGHLGA